jgi:hypothetical protein
MQIMQKGLPGGINFESVKAKEVLAGYQKYIKGWLYRLLIP